MDTLNYNWYKIKPQNNVWLASYRNTSSWGLNHFL